MSAPEWMTRLLPGSFRGVPFKVDSHDADLGRRLAVKEFTLRDDPEVQDTGRQTRYHSIPAFVIGDDYMTQRDALMEALETKGSGRLIHPWLGEMDACVMRAKLSETNDKLGYASFQIQFVRDTPIEYPRAIVDTAETSQLAAAAAAQAAQDRFSEAFDITGQADYVIDSATKQLRAVGSQISQVATTIRSQPDAAAEFARQVSDFTGAVSSLITSPGECARTVAGLIDSLQQSAESPLAAFEALKALFDFSPADPGPTTTPSSQREEGNRQEISRLVSRLALVVAAGTTADMEFDSYDDAIAVRNELLDQFDVLMDEAVDETYGQLVDARSAMSRDITERGLQLPRLARFSMAEVMPALALAWRFYGDAEQMGALIARNKLRDPMFVPANTPIEVLR